MEKWKKICNKIEDREGIWEFETDEKDLIKDYLVGDFDIHDWLDNEAKRCRGYTHYPCR